MIPCVTASTQDLTGVKPGQVNAAAGQAAYDYLCAAIDWTREGVADGIVTAPLHKEGLRAAGLHYPGHTEILAKRTGARQFAMLLSVPCLTVAHVTLHMALRDVFAHLTTEAIVEKIRLLNGVLRRLENISRPRIGVAALNPHASDGGLFGDEEARIIGPAVEDARGDGIDATGPWPSDTLFTRARKGEFDGVVAMYHDQGHIALKLLGGMKVVNISAGLPLVRTSVAHGTAYDIAGRGIADATSLIEAARVAARLAASQTERSGV
jgi:4-hydroxythreonine-4-phosphate dehydrogenase